MLGQSITFTLNLFSKAVVILEVCLGSLSCWNTALRPSFWREGIMLCCNISQYMLEFMFPSMKCNSPIPAAIMQSQTMTFPPPLLSRTEDSSSNFSNGLWHFGAKSLWANHSTFPTSTTKSGHANLIDLDSFHWTDYRSQSAGSLTFFPIPF